MAKSVFQKGKEKAARRKEFLQKGRAYGLVEEKGVPRPRGILSKTPGMTRGPSKTETLRMIQLEETQPKPKKVLAAPKSVFAKGRAKKARRVKFLKETRERGAGAVRRTKPRGRAKRAVKGEKTKAQLYQKAKHLKQVHERNEPISSYNKDQLKRFLMKFGGL